MSGAKSSSIPSAATWLLPAAIIAGAAVLDALRTGGHLAALLPSTVAASKPYATFEEFYPHYLSEHSEQWTKRLHFIGTLITLLVSGIL
jgi:hypothetical protein